MTTCKKCGGVKDPKKECKACARARAARYRAEHPEKAAAAVASCWAREKAKYVASQKSWASKNKGGSQRYKEKV